MQKLVTSKLLSKKTITVGYFAALLAVTIIGGFLFLTPKASAEPAVVDPVETNCRTELKSKKWINDACSDSNIKHARNVATYYCDLSDSKDDQQKCIVKNANSYFNAAVKTKPKDAKSFTAALDKELKTHKKGDPDKAAPGFGATGDGFAAGSDCKSGQIYSLKTHTCVINKKKCDPKKQVLSADGKCVNGSQEQDQYQQDQASANANGCTDTNDATCQACSSTNQPDAKCVTCTTANCADPAVSCGGGGNGGKCDLVGKYVNPLINLFSVVFGLVAVLSIALGGVFYITSEGDPQKVSQAKRRIANTIIAVVIYLFIYSFVQFLVPGGAF